MRAHYFKTRSLQVMISSCLMGALLASCGQNPEEFQVVKDLEVQATKNADQDILLGLSAELDLGDMVLPSVEIPINHPQTGDFLGEISLLSTFEGTNEISVEVNLTHATKNTVNSSSATLPNGKALPIGGIDQNAVISIPVSNTGIKVYIGIAPGMALLGLAVPIAQFDSIGKSVGGLNIFPTFNIRGIQGIAGLFTGNASGQSGLALFVDLSKVIDPSELLKGITLEGNAQLAISASPNTSSRLVRASRVNQSQNTNKMYFYPSSTSAQNMDVVGRKLYDLHRKKAQLKVR